MDSLESVIRAASLAMAIRSQMLKRSSAAGGGNGSFTQDRFYPVNRQEVSTSIFSPTGFPWTSKETLFRFRLNEGMNPGPSEEPMIHVIYYTNFDDDPQTPDESNRCKKEFISSLIAAVSVRTDSFVRRNDLSRVLRTNDIVYIVDYNVDRFEFQLCNHCVSGTVENIISIHSFASDQCRCVFFLTGECIFPPQFGRRGRAPIRPIKDPLTLVKWEPACVAGYESTMRRFKFMRCPYYEGSTCSFNTCMFLMSVIYCAGVLPSYTFHGNLYQDGCYNELLEKIEEVGGRRGQEMKNLLDFLYMTEKMIFMFVHHADGRCLTQFCRRSYFSIKFFENSRFSRPSIMNGTEQMDVQELMNYIFQKIDEQWEDLLRVALSCRTPIRLTHPFESCKVEITCISKCAGGSDRCRRMRRRGVRMYFEEYIPVAPPNTIHSIGDLLQNYNRAMAPCRCNACFPESRPLDANSDQPRGFSELSYSYSVREFFIQYTPRMHHRIATANELPACCTRVKIAPLYVPIGDGRFKMLLPVFVLLHALGLEGGDTTGHYELLIIIYNAIIGKLIEQALLDPNRIEFIAVKSLQNAGASNGCFAVPVDPQRPWERLTHAYGATVSLIVYKDFGVVVDSNPNQPRAAASGQIHYGNWMPGDSFDTYAFGDIPSGIIACGDDVTRCD